MNVRGHSWKRHGDTAEWGEVGGGSPWVADFSGGRAATLHE